MTVGTLVNELFEASGAQPKVIAADLLGRWSEMGGEPALSFDTVVSRISNLRNDRIDGLRFFFGDARRGALLLDMLRATPEQAERIRALAEEALRDGGLQVRMVIDVTPFPAGPALGKALLDLVGDDPLLRPIKLVVTKAQTRALPVSLATQPELCQIEVVDDEEAACDVLGNLSSRPVLVVSQDTIEPFYRWAAVDFDQKNERLVLEPENAIQTFATTGALPEPPLVEHRLIDICPEARAEPFPSPSACAKRRLMLELAAGGPPGVDGAVRLWWAHELEVEAASTARERALARLATANVQVKSADADTLAATLDRARRRPVAGLAFDVNGVLHLVNVGGEFADLPGDVAVQHQVPCPGPAIRQLRTAVATWTEDDWRDDPLLSGPVATLEAGSGPLSEVRHARAWLLQRVRPAPAAASTPEDVIGRLTALLSSPIPHAELLAAFAWSPGAAPWTVDALCCHASARIAVVRRGSPTHGVKEVRSGPLTGRVRRSDRPHEFWQEADSSDDACLDSFEAINPDRSGKIKVDSGDVPERRAVEVHELAWDAADALGATAWRALRRAVVRGDTELLGDRVFFDLGNGVAAVAEARAWARGSEPRIGLGTSKPERLRSSFVDFKIEATLEALDTHSGRNGPLVPSAVWIAGSGIAADVRFIPAPLLARFESLPPAIPPARHDDDDDD